MKELKKIKSKISFDIKDSNSNNVEELLSKYKEVSKIVSKGFNIDTPIYLLRFIHTTKSEYLTISEI